MLTRQLTPEHTTFAIAESTRSEDAVTLPLATVTAIVGLHVELGLPESGNEDRTLIVHGASSSVGSAAVQLAKMAGVGRVVGTAGASADVARRAGCDHVVDYRSHASASSLAQALHAATKGRATHAFDAISEGGAVYMLTEALDKRVDRSVDGVIATVLPRTDPPLRSPPDGIVYKRIGAGTANAADHAPNAEIASRILRKVARAVDEGKWMPSRTRRLHGGLEGVKGGLELFEAKRVAGEKLVVRIGDTPGLLCV